MAATSLASAQNDKGKTAATLKTIFDLTTDEIAKQLTLVEFEIYVSIKVRIHDLCVGLGCTLTQPFFSLQNSLVRPGQRRKLGTGHLILESLLTDSIQLPSGSLLKS